ncbi:AGAP008193-PA-like protein [Anopheles sinensis]|uniref:AGAP008193-PA-like protein n=1 Tax=Anopheles sinensis TaxID=74873 RepID=A0A084WD59_ANOSI|nr:AGAP008193-PA-like protein [Anopheles sinensis]
MRENELFVRVGSDYVDGITDATQVLNVAQIIFHPQYNHFSFANDIAIVQLSTDMNITNFVRPATIWNAESGPSQLVGMNGTVIGFSLGEDGEPSDKLREANLNVIDTKTCLEYDNATYGNRLTSQMYCAARSNSNNVCNGDAGGGMYFNINGTWYLRGIVSFSAMRPNVKPPACDSSKPTVFTDITKYRNWILRYTNTTKWIKALEPCKEGTIGKDTDCNAASRFDSGFLLASQDGNIFRVPMNGDPAFNVSQVNWTYNLAYDCVEGRFYWAEPATRLIFSAKFDWTDKKIFVSEDLEKPSYVAVDWISRRLYWVDREKETIEAASLENPHLRAIVYHNAGGTTVIAVDPLQAKLYRVRGYDALMSHNLDGSEALQLPKIRSKQHLYYDINFSIATGELCYIIALENDSRIECMNTRNKRIRTFMSNHPNTRDLAVTDEMIYWTKGDNDIESMDHHGVRQKPLEVNGSTWYGYSSLLAVTDVCPVFYSPCAINNGDCPLNTLCLLNPTTTSGKVCKCTQNCTEALSES